MNEYYRYKIKLTVNGLNKKSYPTYTVTDTSEEQAFKTILEHLNFEKKAHEVNYNPCLLYTSPSPRDRG